MQVTATRAWRGAALLLVTFTMGCAAATSAEEGAAAEAGASGTSAIAVQNNHTVSSDMALYLEPEGRGERQSLGVVAAGETRTLNVNVERGYYVLIAAHNRGEVRSNRFNVTGPSTINWVMASNRLTVTRR